MPWIGGALAGGGAILSGLMGSSAASDAADAQAQAAAASNATQKYIYDQSRADNYPFLRNGTGANNKLAYLLGIGGQDNYAGRNIRAPQAGQSDPTWNAIWDNLVLNEKMPFATPEQVDALTQATTQRYLQQTGGQGTGQDAVDRSTYGSLTKPITQADIEADPTYAMGMQFGLDQGVKGINRQAAATGGLLSGATLKALTRFGNDYGTQKAGDAVNRIGAQRQQTYSMLGGMSGTGQAASGQTQTAGTNYANAVGNTTVGLGNARGASAVAGANAWTGGINSGLSYYQGNQLMNILNRGGGAGYGGTGYGGPIDPWNGNYYAPNASGGGF
jgi:hypothetical protein